jgi:hypothetical protein
MRVYYECNLLLKEYVIGEFKRLKKECCQCNKVKTIISIKRAGVMQQSVTQRKSEQGMMMVSETFIVTP